jgi:hypothetical protein
MDKSVSGSRDFFEIAAQIIVVMLLAVGLQARLLSARVGRPRPVLTLPAVIRDAAAQAMLMVDYYLEVMSVATLALVAAVVLVVGEFAALGVLLGKAETGDPRLAMGCISFGLIALTIAAFLAGPADGADSVEGPPLRRALRVPAEQSHPEPPASDSPGGGGQAP